MTNKISLANLNLLDRDQFVESLGGIFEHSPWVAELAYAGRPFASKAQLHRVMLDIVLQSSESQCMELICKHPELAGKEAAEGTLTSDSKQEQSRAGLDQCSSEELSQLQSLNRAYRKKFNFPFVIAVTGLDKTAIIATLESRLDNQVKVEFDTSITEIGKIGLIRLNTLIDG